MKNNRNVGRQIHRAVATLSLPAILVGALCASQAVAQDVTTPVSFTGSEYIQDFNTLPQPDATLPTYTTAGPYNVPTNDGGALAGWQFGNSAPTKNAKFNIDNGTSTSGSVFSYGSNGTDGFAGQDITQRALGSLGSGSNISEFGLLLTNDTGGPLNTFTLSYTGEEWRATTADQNKLEFSYSTTASNVLGAPFTSVSALDFLAPLYGQAVTTNGAVDGTVNSAAVTGTVTIPGGWAPGSTLILHWHDNDDKSSDQGLAIDDLHFNATNVSQASVNWNAPGGSGAWDTATPNWTGDSTTFANGDVANFADGHQGTVTVASGGVSPLQTNVTNTTGTYTFASNDATGISGSGELIKSGAGTLTLTGQNSYTGTTVINGGTLSITNDNVLGNGGGVTINGGTLQVGAGGITLLRDITIGDNGGTIDTNGQDMTIGNSDGSGASLTGPGNFVKTGQGTLYVDSTPQYAGTTSVLGGTGSTLDLNLGGATVEMNAPTTPGGFTGNLVLDSALTLHLNSGMIDGGGQITVNAGSNYAGIINAAGVDQDTTATINNNIVTTSGSPFALAAWTGNTLVINGVISGTAEIHFADFDGGTHVGGIVQLNNVNTFQGGMLMETTFAKDSTSAGGVVQIGVDNALPSSIAGIIFGSTFTNTDTPPKTTIYNTGALDLDGHNQQVLYLVSAYDPGSATYAQTNGITNSSSTMSTLTVNDQYYASDGDVFYGPIGAVTMSNFTGTDNVALTLGTNNFGNMALVGYASTYTGPTQILGGALTLGAGASIPNSPITVGPNGGLYIASGAGSASSITNNGIVSFTPSTDTTFAHPGTTVDTPAYTVGTFQGTSTDAQLVLADTVLTITNGGSYAGQITATTGGLAITGGTFKIASDKQTITLGSLSATTGTFDVTNNTVTIVYGANPDPIDAIVAALGSGYNHGAEDGPGIVTSSALATPGSALGYSDNGNQLTITYTWLGDLDLNGVVNAADLNDMSANGTTNATWSMGDFNYDRVINADDYAMFMLGYAESAGQNISSVPEPGMMGLATVAGLALLRRRRRA